MKNQHLILSALSGALLLVITIQPVHAGSATWDLNPTSGDWNTAVNWMPNTVPNGPSNIATFGVSNTTGISLSANVTVDSIVFNPGASAYTITSGSGSAASTLTLSGNGVVNNSGQVQNFVSPVTPAANLVFGGTATAGTMTVFTNQAPSLYFFLAIRFVDSSSADHATFVNEGPTQAPFSGGMVEFDGTSTAGNATFINNGGPHGWGETYLAASATGGNGTFICNGGTVPQAKGGVVALNGTATCGNATIIVNGSDASRSGGGLLDIIYFATAGNATLIANGGRGDGGHLQFQPDGNGGQARVELFGNGELDLVYPDPAYPPVTIGSLEGDGLAYLGAANLIIGGNLLSTTFSGTMADGGSLGGVGAMVTKVGAASLELSGANTYTGGTTINAGTLIVSNQNGSGTGTGPVSVNAGTLGGSGIISGAVTVGAGAFLAPAHGTSTQATLTIQSPLTFDTGSTYTYTFKAKGNKAKTDNGIANGVTINSGVSFNLSGIAQGTLTQGLVLTVISNTAATPIAGTFSNLPDGAIVNVNGNNLQASYEGGDGNDLTLTVVP